MGPCLAFGSTPSGLPMGPGSALTMLSSVVRIPGNRKIQIVIFLFTCKPALPLLIYLDEEHGHSDVGESPGALK